MESLPVEVVAIISQKLTIRDLASCCAVSYSWRELFGSDLMWKPRCERTLVECLKSTECKVEPRFVTPELDSSTLSPVSEWRMCFMRENHLWNNWKLGNYKLEETGHPNVKDRFDSDYFTKLLFFRNDYILHFHDDRLYVWSVKTVLELYTTLPFPLQTEFKFAVFKVVESDKLVIVQGTVVQVYSLNITSKNLQLVITFDFDAAKKFYITGKTMFRIQKGSHDLTTKCDVVGKTLLGYSLADALPKIHIWNVETGLKLKEVNFPEDTNASFLDFRCFEKSTNIVLVSEETLDGEWWFIYFIYSLTELAFLSFELMARADPEQDYVLFGPYFALRSSGTLNVYNYHSCELLYSASASGGVGVDLGVVQNKVVFGNEGVLIVLNPSTKAIEAQFSVNYYDHWLSVMCERFITLSSSDEASISRTTVEALQDIQIEAGVSEAKNITKVPIYSLTLINFVNEAGTRIVLDRGLHFTVVSFW